MRQNLISSTVQVRCPDEQTDFHLFVLHVGMGVTYTPEKERGNGREGGQSEHSLDLSMFQACNVLEYSHEKDNHGPFSWGDYSLTDEQRHQRNYCSCDK